MRCARGVGVLLVKVYVQGRQAAKVKGVGGGVEGWALQAQAGSACKGKAVEGGGSSRSRRIQRYRIEGMEGWAGSLRTVP